MKTRYQQMTAGAIDGYRNFIGDDSDYRDWLGFIGQSRDSKPLERSNFTVAVARLKAIDPDGNDWRKESFGHWACGWIEEVYVRPGSEVAKAAQEMRDALELYPVLDEEHFSELENEEANEVWRNCYRVQDRIDYIRQHRSQFEFRGIGDMLGCIRGNYFVGYASELIS
jgi:hypothetical protein